MTRLLIAGLAALVSACASAPPAPVTPEQLVGTTWHVAGLNAGGVQDRKMTIVFETADQMVGNSACNDYRIRYTLQGQQLRFAKAVTQTTDRLCDPDTVETEERFLATLGEVRSISIGPSGSLVLDSMKIDTRIVARPMTPDAQAPSH